MHSSNPGAAAKVVSATREAERLSYTLTAAAAATGLSIATLRRHAKADHLRFFKVGGRTLVCAASLRELLGGKG